MMKKSIGRYLDWGWINLEPAVEGILEKENKPMTKDFRKIWIGVGVFILGLAILSGCLQKERRARQNDPNPGADFDSTASFAAGSLKLTGNVFKGPVSRARVKFYLLKGNGARGEPLGAKTTDGNGHFSIKFSPKPVKPILVESWGGAYQDEVSGNTVALNRTDLMTAIVPVGTKSIAITPLTHLASTRARALAASGAPLTIAIISSYIGVAQQYNLPAFLGIVPVAPNNQSVMNTADFYQRNYGLILAGLSYLAQLLGVRTYDLISGLAEDLSDGILDGMKGTTPLYLPLIGGAGETIRLPTSAGTSQLHNAIDAFLASANNKTNITLLDISNNYRPVGVSMNSVLFITKTTLPVWTSGQFGSTAITGQGGTLPYHCSLKAGSALPAGFAISDGCVLSGTAEILAAGIKMKISPPFTVVMTDSGVSPAKPDPSRVLADQPFIGENENEFRIIIIPGLPNLEPMTGSCRRGIPCSTEVATATGGIQPYYFVQDTLRNGRTPFGIGVWTSLNYLNALAKGTTKETGTFPFGVCVVDLAGWKDCKQTTVIVDDCAGTGKSCDKNPCCKGTCVPNPKCDWADPDPDNVCYGPCEGDRPVDCGNGCCSLEHSVCKDHCKCGVAEVNPLQIVPGQGALSACIQPLNGPPYQYIVCEGTLLAIGGAPLSGYTWTVSNLSTFPPGTTVLPLTGVFTGTGSAVVEGNYTFNMTVSDEGSHIATGDFHLAVITADICGCPVFQQSYDLSLGTANAGMPFGSSLAVAGGTPPYKWYEDTTYSERANFVSSGLAIDLDRGVVRGSIMETVRGETIKFKVIVKDSTNATAFCTFENCIYSIDVSP